MNVLCAWCGSTLGPPPGDLPGTDGVSHGICERCSDLLLGRSGTPLQQYLDRLGVPVFLVSDEVRMVEGNQEAAAFFPEVHGGSGGMAGRLPGEVFECGNPGAAGECGRTVHCSGCVLRNTITATWDSGTPHYRVPASLRLRESGERIDFLITTVRTADKVALRIDPAGPEPAGNPVEVG